MKALRQTSCAKAVKLLLAATALLLLACNFLPVWSTAMESPQYHGDDTIVVTVYPGRVEGNLREVETLNQYIGVKLPLDAPELHGVVYAMAAFLALVIGAMFLPATAQKHALTATFALMIAGGLAGLGLLQYRLYELGHVRAHAIIGGVPDFTPPVVGSMHLANFHVYTRLMSGGWAFALAILLTGIAVYLTHRDAPPMSPVPAQHRVASCR